MTLAPLMVNVSGLDGEVASGAQSTVPEPRVLVVEDEAQLRRLFVRSLGGAGFRVESAENGREAAELLAKAEFDVILSDVTMPEMSGQELLRLVRERGLETAVILMTGCPKVETAAEAVQYGASCYLTKPVDLASLQLVVRRSADMARLSQRKREAK